MLAFIEMFIKISLQINVRERIQKKSWNFFVRCSRTKVLKKYVIINTHEDDVKGYI